jgi:hypothetical protein
MFSIRDINIAQARRIGIRADHISRSGGLLLGDDKAKGTVLRVEFLHTQYHLDEFASS